MENVTVFNHPLIQHKISLLRDRNTDTNEFRRLVEEIAMLEGFEALSDLPLEDREVETPIEKCTTPVLAGAGWNIKTPHFGAFPLIRTPGAGVFSSRSWPGLFPGRG